MVRTVYRTSDITAAVDTAEQLMDDTHAAAAVANYQATAGEMIIEVRCGMASDSSAVGAAAGSVELRGKAMPEAQTFGAGSLGGQLATSGQARGDSQIYDLRADPIMLKSGPLEIFGAISGADIGAPQIWCWLYIVGSDGAPRRVAVAPRPQAFA